jgi:hypothetical protein
VVLVHRDRDQRLPDSGRGQVKLPFSGRCLALHPVMPVEGTDGCGLIAPGARRGDSPEQGAALLVHAFSLTVVFCPSGAASAMTSFYQ